MTKNLKNKNKNKKKTENKDYKRKMDANLPPGFRIPRNIGGQQKEMYKKLLFDPCGADLVEPPYIGMESGYLTRTRDVIQPFFTDAAATPGIAHDFFIQWSPGNISASGATNYGLLTGGGQPGIGFTCVAGQTGALGTFQSDFINSATTPVNTYRVVACCLQWVPTGPALHREGAISLLSLPSPFINSILTTVTASQAEAACPHVRTNGTESHEIVWIPGSKDQQFDAFTASSADFGYGTLACGLTNVDTTVNVSIGPPIVNKYFPRGRFEITTIWQWTSRNAGGLVQNVQAPSKHTLNDVLSEVKDLGTKIYTGAKQVGTFAKAVSHFL